MKELFTEEEFNSKEPNLLLPLACYTCGETFHALRKYIKQNRKNSSRNRLKFCSVECNTASQRRKENYICTTCGNNVSRCPKTLPKSGNIFCSSSCGATYNNTHKTKGIRRSKLEVYLEDTLIELYPNLEMDFNKTDAIESELDVFIPSMKLGIELNGIFHYEPIYGKEKLTQIKNNDSRKFQACIERQIELCIIDTSQQKYFKEETSKKYLDIITEIIDSKLLNI